MDDAKRGKEQFEYLFLDIEWNQAPGTIDLDGREAIQMRLLSIRLLMINHIRQIRIMISH